MFNIYLNANDVFVTVVLEKPFFVIEYLNHDGDESIKYHTSIFTFNFWATFIFPGSNVSRAGQTLTS